MRPSALAIGCLPALLTTAVWFESTSVIAAEKSEITIPGAPHLLPIDTLAYIRINNADEIRRDFGDSSVGKMLNDPELRPLVSDTYQTLAELFEQIGADLGITLDELLSIPSGQIAAAAVPGNLSPEQIKQIEDDKTRRVNRSDPASVEAKASQSKFRQRVVHDRCR